MIKQYTILGIVICLAVALAALPIRLSTDESISFLGTLKIVSYTFTVSLFAFFLHLHFSKSSVVSFLHKDYIASAFYILLVAITIFPIDAVFDYLFGRLMDKKVVGFHLNETGWLLLILRSFLISTIYYFVVFYLKLLQERQQRNLEIEKLKQAQLEANLSNLKEQMNPHFLFNTLNTLSSITSEKQVKNYVAELANVYRYMLIHNKMNIVTLDQELNFIKSYLYILKTRMGSSIDITINIEENLLLSKMPPLTLQLLLENATKHNITSTNHPLKIDIHNDDKFLIVNNSYKPKNSTQFSTGVGLNNLMIRYELLFSEHILIEKNTKQFTVKLPIIKK